MPADRIAVVHERFTEIAGSEHVVEQLALHWPAAEVFAPIARPSGVPAGISRAPHTSSLDHIYNALGQRSYAPVLPMMPLPFGACRSAVSMQSS